MVAPSVGTKMSRNFSKDNGRQYNVCILKFQPMFVPTHGATISKMGRLNGGSYDCDVVSSNEVESKWLPVDTLGGEDAFLRVCQHHIYHLNRLVNHTNQ